VRTSGAEALIHPILYGTAEPVPFVQVQLRPCEIVPIAHGMSHRASTGVAQAGGDSVDGCGESAVDGV
jgi:hypothetical protein